MDSKVGSKSNEDIQNKLQNGPLLQSRLRYKVARLEVALRDRENQILKLQASTKVTTVNELKLQSQIYYDEILRLKSQLNHLQNQPQSQQPNTSQPRSQPLARVPPNLKIENKKDKQFLSKFTQSPSFDSTKTLQRLEEENQLLYKQLTQLQSEKIRFERANSPHGSRNSKKLDATEHRKRETSPAILEEQKKSIDNLKSEILELRNREKVWQEERNVYKEILDTLKEDRTFYKDVSNKKDEDMEILQMEIVKLHQEVVNLQKNVTENKLKPVPCLECFERTRNEKTSNETHEQYFGKARDSLHSLEISDAKSKHKQRRPPQPPDNEISKKSERPSSSLQQKSLDKQLNHPSTPSSSCSSRISSTASSPSHSHRSQPSPTQSRRAHPSPTHSVKTAASREHLSCDSESSLSKSSAPSSPLSSKQQRSSSLRRGSMNTASLKSPRENNRSQSSSRRAPQSGTASSASSSKSFTPSLKTGDSSNSRTQNKSHEPSSQNAASPKNKVSEKTKKNLEIKSEKAPDSPISALSMDHSRVNDGKLKDSLISKNSENKQGKSSVESPEALYCMHEKNRSTSIDAQKSADLPTSLSPPLTPKRDWIDQEVANEILYSQNNILQATNALNSLLEAHLRRKEMLDNLDSRLCESSEEAEQSTSSRFDPRPIPSLLKPRRQLEPNVGSPTAKLIALLQGHISRLDLIQRLS